ncbi:glycoside hydrolase family 65 protein [Flagellimonas allohymeniacidonis]|uniref:Glycoside hydrolase family 65 protein n=1 Tax=Flagellimonas allohymeniacidonis TaxID=2517819 RepID=A0A4Q8QET5_9FLAO|nr:glycosyl hydrolase family 65 protein [Allomuricauda hymeniacidonis]TAI49012.1 glycoside hydrolase family 65 protein [Allomuricauda hymeniacidonis]
MQLQNNIRTSSGWDIIENSFDEAQLVTTGSNFMIGNGYLGYRGTFEEWGAKEYVACVVTDTWDQAEGSRWSELCNVPNGLFTELRINKEKLSIFEGETTEYLRSLDLKHGINQRKVTWTSPKGSQVQIQVEKFASHDNHHLLVMRYAFKALSAGMFQITTGIDGEVWSINGEHFKSFDTTEKDHLIAVQQHTYEMNTEICVVEGIYISGRQPEGSTLNKEGKRFFREFQFDLQKDEEIVLEKVVSIIHSNEVEDPLGLARDEVKQALQLGYDELKLAHKKHWEAFWEKSDIEIQGNLEAQVLTRFNIYQAYIATPTHDNLPIGARGLSCQVYQGAAFWDQETFNLPMYVYTHPDIAQKLVAYRHDTLQGAKRKAKNLGYYGAFYAWTSGKTGDELFPDFFFTDVLTGRPIRNHFNCWQIHVSPDVVYGIWLYYEATLDWDFMVNQGAEIIFEVAQFLVSRVHFKKDKNRYEIIRLLGPDEYHENVDNNAYTNYLSRYSLQKACEVYQKLNKENPKVLAALSEKIELPETAYDSWKEIADLLYIPETHPETHLIEQFDGYFKLEDIEPDALRMRLIDPGEYWGWPNGIAVNTQVLKQADVVQLMAMLEGFSQEELTANYEYYEPRTEHGSSLSPSVHALVACKANHEEEAYRYFMESATIDLYNASKKVLSGGSFLGGIHTAAAGGVWLIIVKGFAGFAVVDDGVRFNPKLPKEWEGLSFRLDIKQCELLVNLDKDALTLRRTDGGEHGLKVYFKENAELLKPKASLVFKL